MVDKEGNILHTVKTWYENIALDPEGYDSFELCVMNVSRFTVVDDMVVCWIKKKVGGESDMQKIDLIVSDQIINDMNINIQDLSYFISNANDIYIRGKISAKEGYKNRTKTHLIVKGDLLNKDGQILYTIKDWSSKLLKPNVYDLFDLSCCAIHRFLDIHSIAAIKVYPSLCII